MTFCGASAMHMRSGSSRGRIFDICRFKASSIFAHPSRVLIVGAFAANRIIHEKVTRGNSAIGCEPPNEVRRHVTWRAGGHWRSCCGEERHKNRHYCASHAVNGKSGQVASARRMRTCACFQFQVTAPDTVCTCPHHWSRVKFVDGAAKRLLPLQGVCVFKRQ